MAIEFDPKLTQAEKTPHMVTWWSTAHAKMIESKVTREKNLNISICKTNSNGTYTDEKQLRF